MPFLDTNIPDLKIFEPKVFGDHRGYFYESYNAKLFKEEGNITTQFVQDNESKSSHGVIRGLHYQREPYAQAKLVRVIEGKVLDVVVDIREGSPTYGKVFTIVLSQENKRQLFVPRGFAHGFVTLSETAVFAYKVDNYYSKESEGGIHYNDPALKIDWQIDLAEAKVSGKDEILPNFGKHIANFKY